MNKNHDITKSRYGKINAFYQSFDPSLHYRGSTEFVFNGNQCKDCTDSQKEYLLWVTCALL